MCLAFEVTDKKDLIMFRVMTLPLSLKMRTLFLKKKNVVWSFKENSSRQLPLKGSFSLCAEYKLQYRSETGSVGDTIRESDPGLEGWTLLLCNLDLLHSKVQEKYKIRCCTVRWKWCWL